MQTRVVRRLHATSKGSLHHRMHPAAPAVHSCIATISPTTLMTATCTRCRRPRTPSCPINAHRSITQTLHRATASATVHISSTFCTFTDQASRPAKHTALPSRCGGMCVHGARNFHPPRHAHEPALERSAVHRLVFQVLVLTMPQHQQQHSLHQDQRRLRRSSHSSTGSSTSDLSRYHVPTSLVLWTWSGLVLWIWQMLRPAMAASTACHNSPHGAGMSR
jgi:hypothetical protein